MLCSRMGLWCSGWLVAGLLVGCAPEPRAVQEAPVPRAPALPSDPAMKAGEAPPAPSGQGPTDPDSPKDFTTTESGLKYRILRKGDGPQPSSSSTVKCNYRGWTDDGNTFDSSYDRGEPIDFPLSGVIPGWTEGLQLVKKGGMIELEIPSELGYGSRGSPPKIPADSRLHFVVELIDVN